MSQLNVIRKTVSLFSLTWRSPFSKFSDDDKSQKAIAPRPMEGTPDEAREKIDRFFVRYR